ncbi:UDP-glucose 4-epimerase [Halomonadaceae bacterium LMG 33818]|uniref:UDP-glucose 4-epimerase GalE n=1 Tax=Cernens ardua TaxID=3402176 RepID=UPI003EDBBB55
MILVTGGAGYIGSHTVLVLLQAGYDVVVYDNLSNSSEESLRRVEKLTGKKVDFEKGDIRDRQRLDNIFDTYPITAVIHFAGLKAVGESMRIPMAYFDNNIAGSTHLFQAMERANVFNIVFSSSATVYGDPGVPVFVETMPTGIPTNNYGYTKLVVENLLKQMHAADARWKIALLRYFNPVGAHESGEIGEDPSGEPNNLLPYIAQVAVGKREKLNVFGDDYPTEDGTCLRDYIHVMDLAEGHVSALDALEGLPAEEVGVWNLGGGHGHSVLEMVKAFEEGSGQKIPYVIAPRRAGDLAQFWADPSKAKRELGWEVKRNLNAMMKDTWRWQSQNPNGYH